jgi:hypothetical protein
MCSRCHKYKHVAAHCIYPNVRKFWVQKKYVDYAEEEPSGGKRLPRVKGDSKEKVAPSCPQKALSDAILLFSEDK